MQTQKNDIIMRRRMITPKLNPSDSTMIVDGRYLCFRTKYSRGGNLSYNNMDTGIFYGFFNTLQSIANKFDVTNTVIMWDISKVGVRKDEFDGYKKRKQLLTPEEKEEKDKFEKSYLFLMTLCAGLGFACYVLPMYEADDLIGLWCKRYSNGTNIIITRDEDMYQLINENTYVYDPDKKINKDLSWFRRTYGMEPEKWIDYKAIAGCKSDTVPGVPGMGEKRTLAYLKGDKTYVEKIKQYQDLYEMCYHLVILPHPSLKDYWLPYRETKFNEDFFLDFCFECGMTSFIEKIHKFYIFN